MTAALAALVALLVGGGFHAQHLPPRIAEGASIEICGHVTAFVSHFPVRCDASLEVKSGDGPSTVIVIPASIRRGSSGGRELNGAEACFTGVVELREAASNGIASRLKVTRIRIPSFDAIRVTRPSASEMFGSGALDSCVMNGVFPPRILYEARPQYTSEGMRARVQGMVVMDAVVDVTGAISDVQVTRSLDPRVDEQAVKALRLWKFAPATLEDRPVAVIVSVEITFSVDSRR